MRNSLKGMACRAAGALLCAAGAVVTVGVAPSAVAQIGEAAGEGRQRFEIAAGPLEAALAAFARSSGVLLVYLPELARDHRSPGLAGDYTVREALAALLAGTDLEAVPTANGNYTLQRRVEAGGATALPAIRVESLIAESGEVTEGSGSYATRAVGVGGKTARDLRQVQQSVTVITEQRIRDQVLTTAEDALRQSTGVTLVQGTGYTTNASFSSRGFAMGVQTDGGAVGVNNIWYHTSLPDSAILDRVEVLRGSDGLFAGSGAPGGTVNLVRRQPLDRSQVRFDALAASWDRYRTQLDATGPLGFDGRLRGRVVIAEERRHYFYDDVTSEKSVLYGVVNADLSDSTLLVLGTSYEQMDREGLFFGLPRYSTGADLRLPRGTCLCTDWSGREDDTRELFARIEQRLGEAWRIKFNISQQWLDYAYKQGNANGAVNPASGVGPLMAGSRTDVSNTVKLADITLDGSFEIWGLQQELLIGWNWQDMYSDGTGANLYSTRPAVDVFDFNVADFPEPGTPDSYVAALPYGGQRQSGAYVTLRSEWSEGLHSVVGLRDSRFENRWTAGNLYSKQSGIRTPYAGLSYDLLPDVTLYGSYAQIYAPQSYSYAEDGKPIDPIEGDTYEVGAKSAWFEGRLNGSLALYQVERRNAAVRISTPANQPYCCYIAEAESESRGVDVELAGELLQGWQLQVGYSFNRNEHKSGNGANTGTRLNTRTPKHLLKLWTMAQLPGAWSDVRIGGGVNWQSDNYVSGSAATYNPETDEYDGPAVPFRYVQKAHAVVGLRGDYHIDEHWSVGLNVNNLFDERYYQTVATSSSGNYHGEPRHLILSLSGRW